MCASGKLSLLVVHPDSEQGEKLQKRAAALEMFSEVNLQCELASAKSLLTEGKISDFIFVSTRFAAAMLQEFIQEAKLTQGGELSAYILIIPKKSDQTLDSEIIAQYDAFLSEPPSREELQNLTTIASRVKTYNVRRAEIEKHLPIGEDCKEHLDAICFYKALGEDFEEPLQRLRESSKQLSTLAEESEELFLELMYRIFEKLPPPPQLSYSGPSRRVKKQIEDYISSYKEKLKTTYQK